MLKQKEQSFLDRIKEKCINVLQWVLTPLAILFQLACEGSVPCGQKLIAVGRPALAVVMAFVFGIPVLAITFALGISAIVISTISILIIWIVVTVSALLQEVFKILFRKR